MRLFLLMTVASLLFVAACSSVSEVPDETEPPVSIDGMDEAVESVTHDNADVVNRAVAYLRSRGPEGLSAVRSHYADEIDEALDGADVEPRNERLFAAIDRVSRQHTGWASGLYWHTSLEDATAAAAENGRPVLMLRLLGNLDEEFC